MSLAVSAIVAVQAGRERPRSAATPGRCRTCTTRPAPNYDRARRRPRGRRATASVVATAASVAPVASPVQQQTTTDSAIQTNGFADLYAVLGEERDGAAVLRLHVQSAGALDLVRRADHGARRRAVAGRPAAARRRAAPRRRGSAGAREWPGVTRRPPAAAAGAAGDRGGAAARRSTRCCGRMQRRHLRPARRAEPADRQADADLRPAGLTTAPGFRAPTCWRRASRC